MSDVATRTRLNLGSGRAYDPSAVNVDRTSDTKPDVVHDLDVRPWPFPDDRFDAIVAQDVLEHLQDVLATMNEIHRVAKNGARVSISVPHFSSNDAFADPTHRRAFAASTFDYFEEGHPRAFYTRQHFRVLKKQIVFRPKLLNKLVWRIANRFPDAYETSGWVWLFPAWVVAAELEVVKPVLSERGGAARVEG